MAGSIPANGMRRCAVCGSPRVFWDELNWTILHPLSVGVRLDCHDCGTCWDEQYVPENVARALIQSRPWYPKPDLPVPAGNAS